MVFDFIVDRFYIVVLAVGVIAMSLLFRLGDLTICLVLGGAGKALKLNAPLVAATLPANHPGLIEYRAARAERDWQKLIHFVDRRA